MAHLIKQVSDKFLKLQNDFRTPPIETDAFSKITKSSVLQDCKSFNNTQLNDRQCRLLLSQLIYLINQGNKFSDSESSTLFFQITKLFQSTNKELRRMIYLMIKEFRDENTMYIVTQSLMKDITSSTDLYRMNALRTIPLVLDPSNLIQVERYIKNAILDKNYAVSSAAILAAIQLFPVNSESIKKLSSDVTAALVNNKTCSTIHFHAQILLHEIKKNDRNSYIKNLLEQTRDPNGNSGHFSTVQLIRFVKEVLLSSDLEASTERIFIEYLQRQSHKSNEMIIIESCKALCELKNISNKDLTQPITVLSIFIIGSSTVNKYAALKIINRSPILRGRVLSAVNLISKCYSVIIISEQFEWDTYLLIYHPDQNNRSISSLAVSILLKLCNEDDIETLLNQIYENLQDMSDEFKVDILNSVKGLVKQMPKKYKIIMVFLFNCMKNEGNTEFKIQCIDIVEEIITQFPSEEVREQGLQVLSEYIEDCLVKTLQLKALSIINRESSKTTATLKMIRLINNRIHLEDAEVRAAAVGTISKFALKQPDVISQVIPLLKHALNDPDEEVRERAFQNITMFEHQSNEEYLQDMAKSAAAPIDFEEITFIEKYIESHSQLINSSEEAEMFSREKIYEFARSKNIKIPEQVAVHSLQTYEDEFSSLATGTSEDTFSNVAAVAKKEEEKHNKYSQLFSKSPIFSKYGTLRHAVNAGELTESVAEYQVSAYKYFFDEHIVLEFLVKNTAPDQVALKLNSDEVDVALTVPASEIKEGETSNVFVCVARHPECKVVAFQSQCFLNFTVCEIAANGQVISQYADESQLEDISVTISDHLTHWDIPKGKFETELSCLGGEVASQKFKLSYKSVDFAIQEIIKHFSIQLIQIFLLFDCNTSHVFKDISICEASNIIPQIQTEKFHTLKLAGKYLDNHKFIVQCLIAMDAKQGCVLQMNVKSAIRDLNDDLINTFNN